MTKVSILIPCYNSESFIAETLESCIRQTYKNWEVIVVDDGSQDRSFEIASKYESENIKLYRQSNLGACRARNLAFEKSSGSYVVYLDADDILSPNYIAEHLAILETADDDSISFCPWGIFCNKIEETVFNTRPIYKNYTRGAELLIDMWYSGNTLQTSSFMTPRNLIVNAGGWDETVLKNQDGEFFSRVLLKAREAKFVNNARVYYRKGSYQSVSRNISEKTSASILYTLCSYRKNIIEYEDSERVRIALAIMFTNFIYTYGNMYPHLYKTAKHEIELLNTGYILKNEPHKVIQISQLIGFENFMRLRKVLFKR